MTTTSGAGAASASTPAAGVDGAPSGHRDVLTAARPSTGQPPGRRQDVRTAVASAGRGVRRRAARASAARRRARPRGALPADVEEARGERRPGGRRPRSSGTTGPHARRPGAGPRRRRAARPARGRTLAPTRSPRPSSSTNRNRPGSRATRRSAQQRRSSPSCDGRRSARPPNRPSAARRSRCGPARARSRQQPGRRTPRRPRRELASAAGRETWRFARLVRCTSPSPYAGHVDAARPARRRGSAPPTTRIRTSAPSSAGHGRNTPGHRSARSRVAVSGGTGTGWHSSGGVYADAHCPRAFRNPVRFRGGSATVTPRPPRGRSQTLATGPPTDDGARTPRRNPMRASHCCPRPTPTCSPRGRRGADYVWANPARPAPPGARRGARRLPTSSSSGCSARRRTCGAGLRRGPRRRRRRWWCSAASSSRAPS